MSSSAVSFVSLESINPILILHLAPGFNSGKDSTNIKIIETGRVFVACFRRGLSTITSEKIKPTRKGEVMKMFFRLILAVAAFLVASAANAYTIDVVPSSSGGLTDINAQIKSKLQSLTPGTGEPVYIVLQSGTFNVSEGLNLSSSDSVYGRYNIVDIGGTSDDQTVINIVNSTAYGVRVEGFSHVTLHNFQIRRATGGSSEAAIRVANSPYLTIQHTKILQNRSADGSIRVDYCDNAVVFQNIVKAYSTLLPVTRSDNTVAYTVLGYGVKVTGGNNIQITFNVIWEESPFPAYNWHDSAAVVAVQSTGALVRGNNILNAGQQAIDTNGSRNVDISANFIDGAWGSGIKLANGSADTVIHDNVIKKCGEDGIVVAPGAEPTGKTVTNTTIENNSFYEMGQGFSRNPATEKHYYFTSGYLQGNRLAMGIYLDGGGIGGIGSESGVACPTNPNNVLKPTVIGVTITNNHFYDNSAMFNLGDNGDGITQQRCNLDSKKPPYNVTRSGNALN